MLYTHTVDLGDAGEHDFEVDIDDGAIIEYVSVCFDIGDLDWEEKAEKWTHDNVYITDWLDKEDDPDATLDWVLKNVPMDDILSAIEKEVGGCDAKETR